jgi:hypothetical protein
VKPDAHLQKEEGLPFQAESTFSFKAGSLALSDWTDFRSLAQLAVIKVSIKRLTGSFMTFRSEVKASGPKSSSAKLG